MGEIGSIVAPAASIAAHSNAPQANRTDQQTQQVQNATTAIANNAATVVSLSGSAKDRAPSHGPSKVVDATFEKQGSRASQQGDKSGKKVTKGLSTSA